MGIRQDFAAALAPHMPPNVRIIDHDREIDTIAATERAVITLARKGFSPGPTLGSYNEEFDLNVIEPRKSPEDAAEDALEEITHEVRDALESINWLTWSKADRGVYMGLYPSYVFTVTIRSLPGKTEPDETEGSP